MLGLIIKDIRTIKNQGIVMFLMAVAALGIIMNRSAGNAGGFVAYAIVLGMIYAFNTVSWDAHENGYAFLFTLPVTPRLYVAEKYVLSLLFSAGACLLSGAVAALFLSGGVDLWIHCVTCGIIWVMFLWMPIVMMPLQLKFGAEKGRVLAAIAFGCLFGLCLLVAVHLENNAGGKAMELAEDILSRLEKLIGMGGLLALAGLISVAAYLLSMAVSMHIMEKKEF